ncbi:MAG: hypothetical protein L6R41_001794 [Letrouitia leprolyta]|nr:MAG: hypothetical protein L6R41_001794 [Letrouitia leprolyta]
MSRYPPPDHPARDRSPHRFSDRRSSTSYNPPLSTRVSDANYRSFDANAHPHPPRGPKADVDRLRGGYSSRGRGFAARGDLRDRDFRDSRDARGGRDDRGWSHRTLTDRRGSPPPRGRTRSPQRDYGWDSRDLAARDLDRDRSRREAAAETAHPVGYRGRGSYRGRGRGEWDHGYRGRGGHGDDREGFRGRGRSQDRGWDRASRDDRERDRDREQDHESVRHEDSYRRQWEDKDRDVDKHRREPPFRPDSRNSSATNPSTPLSATGPPLNQQSMDRANHSYRGPGSDSSRRSSGPNSISNYPTPIQRADAPSSRSDRDRFNQQPPQPPSSPPQAPQVPAFGSITYKPPATVERAATATTKGSTKNISAEQISHTIREPSRQPPSAPKAQLSNHAPPTAPRAEQQPERIGIKELTPQITQPSGMDRPSSGPTPTPATVPIGPKSLPANNQGDLRSSFYTPIQARRASEYVPQKVSELPSSPQIMSGSTSLQMVHPSRREVIEESGRSETTVSHTTRPTHREISIPGQQSPAKVPTGPRAERAATSNRQPPIPPQRSFSNKSLNPQWGRGQSNLTWVRPGLSQGPAQHTPRGPSIMKTVPTKRDNVGEEKLKTPLPELDDRDPFESSWPQGGASLKAALDAAKAEGGRLDLGISGRHSAKPTELVDDGKTEASTKTASPQLSSTENLSQGRTKEGAEDASMDLNDDDYEVSERNFNREMQMLEARRPPPHLHHPELSSLVEECDALASAAEDLANGFVPRIATETLPTQMGPLGLPSPKAEESEKVDINTDVAYNFNQPLIHQQTPPIESLPFLASGPPTPFSQIDDAQYDDSLQELVRCRIEDDLTAQYEQLDSQSKQIKAYFASRFRSWRLKNLVLEEQEKARNDAAPQSTPEDTVSIIGSAVPSISGKNNRVIRNTSDFQMEAALKLSEQTAAEEAEKRAHHQAGDRAPNFDKEAIVPDMLSGREMTAFLFNDKNNLIPNQAVMEALAFVPKKDDFSAEEHDKFVENYILNPKRWGTIADLIPGRTYQDCVQHYYLTKGTCAYKEKEKAFLRIKKGRRGPRGQPGRAKSSNLIPLYDGNPENDPGATAVTETGRPKRTAAPVFGASGEIDPSAPASTPLRHNSTRAKVEMNGELSAEKPRQKGRTALRGGGTRKGRAAPLLAAAPGPSPQKGEKDLGRGRSREPKVEIEQGPEDLEGAQLLAGLHNSHVSNLTMDQHPSNENWVKRPNIPVNTTTVGPPKMQQPVFEPQFQPQEQRGGQSVTSSYWSVPEHTDFQNLLAYFGTNWQAIADTIKTKSVAMVKAHPLVRRRESLQANISSQQVRNYYNRECNKDRRDFFKQIAQIADEKIRRGEDMGPLPAPTVQTKRRTENTPQLTAQRTLAPSIEHVDHDSEAAQTQPTKPVQLSSPQTQVSQTRYPVLAQAEAVPLPVFSQTSSQGPVNSNSRSQQSSQQRVSQLQGPRSGFFSPADDRPRPLLQAQPPVDAQKHHQQQRQVHQENEGHRIRPHETQNHTEVLKRQQKQDFLDKLEQQHHIRHAEQAAPQQSLKHPPRHTEQTQAIVHPQPPTRSQSTANSQPFYPPSHHMSSQVRIAPSQPPELEPRPRFSSQPQQAPLDNPKQESLTALRCLDSNAQDQGRHTIIHSPSIGRLPPAAQSLAENTRPSSISGPPSQPAPKPAPAQAKRSNIMSILNDEPSEPAPPRRRHEDGFPVPSQTPQQASVPPIQAYQAPSQPSRQTPTQDPGIDKQYHLVQSQHRMSTSQSNIVQQQQQQWERPNKWAAAAVQPQQHEQDVAATMRHTDQERASVNAILAKSPHSQPLWPQQLLRGPGRLNERSHASSPPPASNTHSRTSSYNGGLVQQQMQPQAPKQSSQPTLQAAPNLQPSPYATIQPHQTTTGHSHQQQVAHSQQQARLQQEQMQRQIEEQRQRELNRRARQEALLQQEVTLQQYHQQQRPPEAPRQLNEPSNPSRPREPGYGEFERRQEKMMHYQATLMQQEQERRQEQARREQRRVYTPPVYQNHGYAAPPQPPAQQQRGQGPGR